MNKFSKLALAAAFFFAAWTSSNEAKAQVKEAARQQKEQVLDLSKLPATTTGGVRFYDNGRRMKLKDSIQQGSIITVVVFWSEKQYSKVAFNDTTIYQPTAEDIKNRKYTFKLKPIRTTIYEYTFFSEKEKPSSDIRVVKVLDKNGKEIK